MKVDKVYVAPTYNLELTEDEYDTIMEYLGNSTYCSCQDAGVDEDTVVKLYRQMKENSDAK